MTDPAEASAAKSRPGLAVTAREAGHITRSLPEETPVALTFDGTTLAVMMATPKDLEDFAVGFALSEQVIDSPRDIDTLEILHHPAGIEARLLLGDDRSEQLRRRQRAMMGPVGCGLCGIDSLEGALPPLPAVQADPRFSREEVAQATDELRRHQPLHDLTHAVHAAGFLLPGQGIILAREDVGRHNALDKLIGALAQAGQPPADGAIVLTSRVSVEMVQKTAHAGAAVIIAASAPTAHALRLAEGAGLTVAAFARGGRFDLYSNPHRIEKGASDVA